MTLMGYQMGDLLGRALNSELLEGGYVAHGALPPARHRDPRRALRSIPTRAQ